MLGRAALLFLSGLFLAGCYEYETTYTIPPFDTKFDLPLPPGIGIDLAVPLPNFELCKYMSTDIIVDEIRKLPAGGLLVGLFKSFVHIEQVSPVEATMVVLTPENGTFDGIEQFQFLINGSAALIATSENGIDGGTVHFTTDEPLNLVSLVESCAETPATIKIGVKGVIPDVLPTSWRNTILIYIKARIGLF